MRIVHAIIHAPYEILRLDTAQDGVPVARTAHEPVERLRTWASGRCLGADAPGGIYNRNPNVVSKPGRRVRRADPSSN